MLDHLWRCLHLAQAKGVGVGIEPGQLGAAFFIPTVIVTFLLVTHVLIFMLLLRPAGRLDLGGGST